MKGLSVSQPHVKLVNGIELDFSFHRIQVSYVFILGKIGSDFKALPIENFCPRWKYKLLPAHTDFYTHIYI